MESHYSIEFKIYHYNSGAADNGTYTHTIRCNTLEEAQSIKKKIDNLYYTYDFHQMDDESNEDLKWFREYEDNYTPCGGILESKADIYLITKTKI
jgi:hypothetical protein